MAKNVALRGRGRPAAFGDKFAVAAALRGVAAGENTASYYLTRQLVEKGFVEAVPVQTGTRGRPAVNYELTAKGRTYVNFSKNWK